MNLIFFGAPGVGKGTQAEIMASRLGIPHISTGAIFRAAIAAEKPIGLELKKYVDQGLLVPDEVTTAVALDALQEPECSQGFILDGYPRNLGQAQALSAALAEQGRTIERVVYLTAPSQEISDRMLKRGRPDDIEEVILRRLEVYRNETEPVLNFYRQQGLVTEVYGVGEINDVHECVFEAIGKNGDG